MIYKVKITMVAGEISEIIEVETDDKELVREIFTLDQKEEEAPLDKENGYLWDMVKDLYKKDVKDPTTNPFNNRPWEVPNPNNEWKITCNNATGVIQCQYQP